MRSMNTCAYPANKGTAILPCTGQAEEGVQEVVWTSNRTPARAAPFLSAIANTAAGHTQPSSTCAVSSCILTVHSVCMSAGACGRSEQQDAQRRCARDDARKHESGSQCMGSQALLGAAG